MSIDTTTVRFCCPFCDEDFATERRVRKHISELKSGDHQGINGFEMDRTIEVAEDKDRLPIHDRIVMAADEFDELSYEQARKVAKAADVSRYRVLREWEDANKDLKDVRKDSPYKWENLSDGAKDILAERYRNPNISQQELANRLDRSKADVSEAVRLKGFLLEDRHRADETAHWPEEESVGKAMGLTNKQVQAMLEAGVDLDIKVIINDDYFEAMRKLIESREAKIARDLFYDE